MVNGQTTNLGAARLERAGYRACLGAVAVEGERFEGRSCQVDGIPFKNKRSLSGVSQAQDGRRGGFDAVGIQDALLESLEGRCVGCLSCVVARDGNVNNAAGRDAVGKED